VRFDVFKAAMMMIFLWDLAVDLRMETVCFSETLASADKPTRHQNAEERDQVREYRFTDSFVWEN
jgi:hypothetical protein